MVKQITEAAQKLNPAHQQAALDYLLDLLAKQEAEAAEAAPEVESPANGSDKAKAKGWVEVKTINGHQYAYRRYREGKTLKSEYVGKVKA